MRILVTGFDSFPGMDVNITKLVVERLRTRAATERADETVWEVLPTSYRRSEERLTQLLAEFSPELVIMLGVSESVGLYSLERFAVNVADCSTADVDGDLRRGELISTSGDSAYTTPVDLDALLNALLARDVPVGISNHAGTYVCNYAYYSALMHAVIGRKETRVLFVHVPVLPTTGIANALSEGLVQAASDNVATIVRQVRRLTEEATMLGKEAPAPGTRRDGVE